MRALLAGLRRFAGERVQYYRDDREAIAADNIRALQTSSCLTLGFLLVFLAVSPWALPGWRPSVWHLAFVPAAAGMCVLAAVLGRRGKKQPALGTALCVLYEAVLYLGVLLIDAPGSPEAPATFLSLVVIAMPALFNLPFRITYGLILLAAAGYTAAALLYKPSLLVRYDLFQLAASVVFSLAVSYMTSDLRIRAYKVRRAYQQQSTHDLLLPELYNRAAFEQAVRSSLAAAGPGDVFAFGVVDLDDFKQINDTQGHLFGDTVLQSLGRAMREVGRPGDLVGRFGGDEFVLFAQGNISEEGVRQRFGRLGDALKEAVPPGCPVSITCSLGIVCASGQGVEYEQLFRQADAALYRAKAMGKNTFCLTRYQPE